MTDAVHLVVGSGPTAVIAAAIIQSTGVPTTLITTGGLGMLTSTEVEVGSEIHRFTMVPIFPPRSETALSLLLADLGTPLDDAAADLKINYRFGSNDWRKLSDSAAEVLTDPTRSFGTAMKALGLRTQILAQKQYGDVLTSAPMMLVRQKIARAYFSTNNPVGTRRGYVAGESPYTAPTRHLLGRLHKVNGSVVMIDRRRHTVRLNDGTCLGYVSLTFASDVRRLCSALGMPDPDARVAPALFVTGTRAVSEANQNAVIYDERPDSPIFRVALPTTSTWVAQLSLDPSRWNDGRLRAEMTAHERTAVTQTIAGLIDGPVETIGPPVWQALAYPIDPLSPLTEERIDTVCGQANILRFGRFAQWRYIDLHELAWEMLTP